MQGLVSVSFRQLTPAAIVEAAAASGLSSIEWGGDVHVPAGDSVTAEHVRRCTEEAGLRVSSYGSYYRIGHSNPADFAAVLASARALGTHIIRVWAYVKPRSAVDDETYAGIVRDARRMADMAEDMDICLECHHGTLTEDYHDALDFLRDVDRINVKTYWQPNQFRSFAYNLASAEALAPYCRCVHVFDWEGKDRYPLAHGTPVWKAYIDVLRAVKNPPAFLLEFMHDDRVESLPETAATLIEWLS